MLNLVEMKLKELQEMRFMLYMKDRLDSEDFKVLKEIDEEIKKRISLKNAWQCKRKMV